MSLYIGNVKVEGNLFLGPMAGVTDLPFRVLCKEQGAALVFTEMVSAKGILYNNKNTDSLLEIAEEERPAALQLFGSDPDIIADMAKRIEGRNFDILDINMGCPVPKVVKNGEGSALMKEPALVGRIVNRVSKAINKPVTVKIRSGFSPDSINAVEIARIAEDNGAAAVTVHGRTREQYYKGKANWDIICQVKEAISIPVIGSGDVQTAMDARRILEQTGCDGIMIARGARGNPWVFSQINEFLNNGTTMPIPDIDEVKRTILRHAKLSIQSKGEYTGIREMRKHIAWYTAGYPQSAKLRYKANEIDSIGDLEMLLEEFVR